MRQNTLQHVEVADNQLSLAIGKSGQNVRLAARLTNWKIDIKGIKGEEVDETGTPVAAEDDFIALADLVQNEAKALDNDEAPENYQKLKLKNNMNLWHDVPRGTPEELNVIIEIPKGSSNKYEIDKETGLIALDRANYSSAPYPFDYGFVPQTLWHDGDAIDVIVLTTFPLNPGILVAVRPIAVMDMTDTGDSDAKIIAVPVNDKRWEDTKVCQILTNTV
jgi:inorganic pyrophosphatase